MSGIGNKKLISFSLVMVACLLAGPLSAKSQKYRVDPGQSKMRWEGKKVTGSHNGTIQIREGVIVKEGKSFKAKISIDMNSIVCKDIKDREYNQKLVDHLKSQDFFHTAKHKTAKLELLKAEPKKGNTYTIFARITVRGISQKLKFPAKVKFTKNRIQAEGEIKIDRTKFNIKYNSGKFFKSLGDKLIHDDFSIRFSIRANLSAPKPS